MPGRFLAFAAQIVVHCTAILTLTDGPEYKSSRADHGIEHT
jgi:hypothetical protein